MIYFAAMKILDLQHLADFIKEITSLLRFHLPPTAKLIVLFNNKSRRPQTFVRNHPDCGNASFLLA